MSDLPIFQITSGQERALADAIPRDTPFHFDDRYFVMPFHEFVVSSDEHIHADAGGDLKQFRRNRYTITMDGPYLRVDQREMFRTPRMKNPDFGFESFKMDFASRTGTWMTPPGEPDINGTDERYWNEWAVLRICVGFILMLNQRTTRCTYIARTVNEERRARRAGIIPEQRISVYIGREIVTSVRSAAAGKYVCARSPHHVRGHLRRLGPDVVTKVRPHQRGGLPTAIPIYDAKALEIAP